jgi:Fe2+ transport system protein FeoA
VDHVVPLTQLKRGDKALIFCFDPYIAVHFSKLSAFGILPDVMVSVMQSSPAVILKIDYTQVALDRVIAAGIMVINVNKK